MLTTFTPIANPDGSPSFEASLEQWTAIYASYVGVRANLQQLLDQVGGGDVLVWVYEPGSLPPAWSMSRQGNAYYLAIAGTTTATQWAGHVVGAAALEGAIEGAAVNRFWQYCWDRIRGSVYAVLPLDRTGITLSVTGHSLGGAVAQIAARELAERISPQQVSLLAFGQPKAFTSGYMGPLPHVYFRMQRDGDPVPYLPPLAAQGLWVPLPAGPPTQYSVLFTWQHYGQSFTLGESGTITPSLGEFVGGWLQLAEVPYLGFDRHLETSTSGVFLAGASRPGQVTSRGWPVAQLLAQMSGQPLDPALHIAVLPSVYTPVEAANATYFGNRAGPITETVLNAPQLLAHQLVSSSFGGIRNIQEAGGSMATPSGLWRIQAKIKAGSRGKGAQVVWNGSTSILAARSAGSAWALRLAQTFGNGGALGAEQTGSTAASPRIAYLRITDALQPRIGQLFDMSDTNLYGWGTGSAGDSSADFISTALAVRIPCMSTDPSNKIVYSGQSLYGIPDRVVVNGDQINLNVAVGPRTMDYWVNVYLNYLTTTANQLGCITPADNAVQKQTGPWSLVQNIWTATLANHGYATKDRIRMTNAGARGWNGTYQLVVPDVNTIQLKKGPPTCAIAPTSSTVQRIQLANGTRPFVFARFQAPQGGWVTPYLLKVAKRNPAQVFSPVSFPKKPRRVY